MGRQEGGKYMYRQVGMGRLVGRQVGRHARIYTASFEPAEGRLQKLVMKNSIILPHSGLTWNLI